MNADHEHPNPDENPSPDNGRTTVPQAESNHPAGIEQVTPLQAAVILRHQGKILSAQQVLEEARSQAEAHRYADSVARIQLGEASCWMDRAAFRKALQLTIQVEQTARERNWIDIHHEAQCLVDRIHRNRFLWWFQVGVCLAVFLGGWWWSPIGLDERLEPVFPWWVFQLVSFIQFSGIGLTLAQMTGVISLTSPDRRHLAHRFRYPHLVLLGWPLILCLLCKPFDSQDAVFSFGLIISQSYLILIPLAFFVTLIPLFERWPGGWRPLVELTAGFIILVYGLNMPDPAELLVVSNQVYTGSWIESSQSRAWFKVLDRVETKTGPTSQTLSLRGSAYLGMGEEFKAIEHFEQALALDPDHLYSLNDLAWLLLTAESPELRDPSRGLVLAERAMQVGGDEKSFAVDTYAEALFQTGQTDRAIEMERKAIELERKRSWFQRNLKPYEEQLDKFTHPPADEMPNSQTPG